MMLIFVGDIQKKRNGRGGLIYGRLGRVKAEYWQ